MRITNASTIIKENILYLNTHIKFMSVEAVRGYINKLHILIEEDLPKVHNITDVRAINYFKYVKEKAEEQKSDFGYMREIMQYTYDTRLMDEGLPINLR